MVGAHGVATGRYALGHTDRELERLSTQARLIDPITRRFFREAGIGPGMRVLEVGSGAGDVAILVADLVGDAGEVVGTDPAPAAIATAQARVKARSLRNVTFRQGYPSDMTFERPFDAVCGRYVLEFIPEPATVLRALARHVRPGGVVVFHELDLKSGWSFPPVPSYDRCCRLVDETIRGLGADTRMGIKLHGVFVAAGLPVPTMRLEAVIGGAAGHADHVRLMVDVARTVLPDMERLGVATASDLDIDALLARIEAEVAAGDSVIACRSEIGAWSRV